MFRNASISLKLTIIMALASTFALMIATGGFLYVDLNSYRNQMAKDLMSQAKIIGSNSTASISFRDTLAATQTLRSLVASDDVLAAALYTPDGKQFAHWGRTKLDIKHLPAGPQSDGVIQGTNQVGVFSSIFVDREHIGSVYIGSTLNSWRHRRERYTLLVAVLILVGVGFTLVIGSQLQRIVSRPIQDLAREMRTVAEEQDFGRRFNCRAGGEIGDLADGFNSMIAEIEQRRQELRNANEVLETRVLERTRELQREISERIAAEETLEANRRALEEFFENATVGLLWLGPDGKIVRANAVELQTLGYDSDQYVGHFYEEFHASPGDAHDILSRLSRGETLANYETRMIRSDGQVRTIVIDSNVLWDEGRFVHARCFTRDVTALKEAEEAERARIEAERASTAKSEFLSRMSHELRTPMNAILGFAQLLQMDALTEDQTDSVYQIRNAGEHLLRLINEVLDISRIESGVLTISQEPVCIFEVASEVRSLIQPIADQRGVGVSIDVGADQDLHVIADRQRLLQVILNLVSNAVKYNREQGSVQIKASILPDHRVRISVEDTGIGIKAERVQSIFTPFERLGAEHSEIEGTGLGLALSKRLVEAMGGAIDFKTSEAGTTFFVDLGRAESPLSVLPDQDFDHPADVEPTQGVERCVLLIEDNLSNVKLMERVMTTRPDVRLIVAMTGSLGFDLAQEHNPDLILLDLNLPDCHGSELLERFRELDALRDTPVVVVSADATPSQVNRLMSIGAYRYITKPLDVKQLLGTLDEVFVDGVSAGWEERIA